MLIPSSVNKCYSIALHVIKGVLAIDATFNVSNFCVTGVMKMFKKVISLFLLVRIIQSIIIYSAPIPFDTSTSIFISKFVTSDLKRYPLSVTNFLSKMASWDAVYFLKLSLEGITFEHEWVFGPLWWRALHWINFNDSNLYDTIILTVILNNIFVLLSCFVIYLLSLRIIIDNPKLKNVDPEQFAMISSLLLLVQPSGIFSTISYTESSSQFLCYFGLYLRQISIKKSKISNVFLYLISGLIFSVAFGIRSNCLLYGILFFYDLINIPKLLSKFVSFIAGLQLFVAFLYSVYLPYFVYCPERGEWCNSFSKSLTSFAQAYYWNVGFLKYFTLANVPLFLLASPQFLIVGLSLIVFKSWANIRGEWVVAAIYLFVQFTVMHVQIINRVSTFISLHIWYVSYLICTKRKLGSFIVQWWIVWIFLQTGLYACFLPPA